MRVQAIVATAKGGPEVLKLEPVELAWPRHSHDVLVRIEAAGVNPADSYFRQLGGYITGPAPLVLGHDGAGVVEAVGANVSGFQRGERVCFCHGGIGGDFGTYAEYAVVPAEQLAKVPESVPLEISAALPLVAITAWEALYDRARVTEGEHVLIHAGAGGTGHIAVQLAVLRGARVATTVSSLEKIKFVTDLGAELPINYHDQDFVAAVMDWSSKGAAVALDNVGGSTILKTYRAMAPYGRIVTLIGTSGDDADTTAYNRNLTLHNVMMLTPMWKRLRHRLAEQTMILNQALALVGAGKLRIHISARFPLDQAAEAHERLDVGGNMGKIVLMRIR